MGDRVGLRQVGRSFETDGVVYQTGDVIDVSAMGPHRVQRLQTLRYLLPAPRGAEPTVKEDSAPPVAPEKKAPVKKAAAKPAARKAPAKKAAAPRKAAAKKAPAKKAAVEPAPSK